MNYPLAKEIYGMNPFCVDSQTLPAMSAILKDIRNRVDFEEIKNSQHNIFSIDSEMRLIDRGYQLNSEDDFQGVGVVSINGPILLNSGASTQGMKEVSQSMENMANDQRIRGFVLLIDSGGGSTAAVELMADTINEIKSQGKPVHALIDKGGTLASAAYGIASACDSISYQSEMSIVGSLGTMIQMSGREANTGDGKGVKYIRLYATESVNKNKAFEEALNNNNYDLIVNDLLDPINQRFLAMLKQNRPQLLEANLDGSISFAKDAEGTYVDKKSSLQELCQQIINAESPGVINRGQNNNPMNKEKLKQEHPEVYQEIFALGVSSENERVCSWLAHIETDSDSVVKGIESAESITQSQREKFFVKQNRINQLAQSRGDNADDFVPGESSMTEEESKKKAKEAEITKSFNFEIK